MWNSGIPEYTDPAHFTAINTACHLHRPALPSNSLAYHSSSTESQYLHLLSFNHRIHPSHLVIANWALQRSHCFKAESFHSAVSPCEYLKFSVVFGGSGKRSTENWHRAHPTTTSNTDIDTKPPPVPSGFLASIIRREIPKQLRRHSDCWLS